MPNTEILDILTITFNTIGTQQVETATKCSTNKANGPGSGCEQQYISTRQEASRPEKCYENTDCNSNSKSNNVDKPSV